MTEIDPSHAPTVPPSDRCPRCGKVLNPRAHDASPYNTCNGHGAPDPDSPDYRPDAIYDVRGPILGELQGTIVQTGSDFHAYDAHGPVETYIDTYESLELAQRAIEFVDNARQQRRI
jgi:hypothetical protein